MLQVLELLDGREAEHGIAATLGLRPKHEADHEPHDEQDVTVSCAGGDEGVVTEGLSQIDVSEEKLDEMPVTRTDVMLNLANPSAAFRWWRLPIKGVGLARMEFVVNNAVRVHPMALLNPDRVGDAQVRAEIDELLPRPTRH